MVAKPVRRRLTADDFDQMCSAGILTADDRVELIDGELIEMPPMGHAHTGIVNRLAKILFLRLGDAAEPRIQSSVRLSNRLPAAMAIPGKWPGRRRSSPPGLRAFA